MGMDTLLPAQALLRHCSGLLNPLLRLGRPLFNHWNRIIFGGETFSPAKCRFIDKVAKEGYAKSFIGATHWTSNERQADSAAFLSVQKSGRASVRLALESLIRNT